MLKVHQLHELLSHGELQNLAMGNNGIGTIREQDHTKIRDYANDAMLRLYSRFVMKEKDVLIRTESHITNYHLLPRFSVNYVPKNPQEDEPDRYILDLPEEPFTNDVLKILNVFDCAGNKLPLNDSENKWSVFTPRTNVLQVPRTLEAGIISVQYQAKPARIGDDLDEDIDLPDVLWPALTAFIAYKAHSYMNQQDSTAKAQEHLGMYESVCKSVKDDDLVNTSIITSNIKPALRGWI